MRTFGMRVVSFLLLWMATGYLSSFYLGPTFARAAENPRVQKALQGFTGHGTPPAWAGLAVLASAALLASTAISLTLLARRRDAAVHSAVAGDAAPPARV